MPTVRLREVIRMSAPQEKVSIHLLTILELWYQNEVSDIKIVVNGEELYSNADVLDSFMFNFADYYFTAYEDWATASNFKALWKMWIRNNGENLYRQYHALFATYDPLHNYDMMEMAADGKRIDKTTKETQPTGKTISEIQQDRNAIGSAATGDPIMHTKTETSYDQAKSTETETPSNTQTMSFDGGTLTGYHDAAEHYLQRSGNIGTTTSMQMIRSEVEGRRDEMVDLLYDFIKRFVDRYCYYVG